jgi:hypothetical protein
MKDGFKSALSVAGERGGHDLVSVRLSFWQESHGVLTHQQEG